MGRVFAEWDNGATNVLAALPTGAGKTVIFTRIMALNKGPTIAIAHRHELVGQISLALARHGVTHRIIGARETVRLIVRSHLSELRRSYYDPGSNVAVASVDTLNRRQQALAPWLSRVTLWVQDEAHHILRDNKWGHAVAACKGARGLGVTATPGRTDRRGLGRAYDGVFDTLIEGPSMREIIGMGFLCDYRVFAPRVADLDLDTVPVSKSTGDYIQPKLRLAVRRSRIVGDVVRHYCRLARGKLGVTFATDVQSAVDLAEAYRAAGVPAEAVSHHTTDRDRYNIIKRFKRREILQLTNVDLFGEGFDLPAIEVASFARPTASLGLYVQQFGRALRIMKGKEVAIIIDHVGNVVKHGLPDSPRDWSLARETKATKGIVQVRACPRCTAVYERVRVACPFCGFTPVPVNRSGPDVVEGDLEELDPAVLAQLRTKVRRTGMSPAEYRADLIRRGCPAVGVARNVRRHEERAHYQRCMLASISTWGGLQRALGRSTNEIMKRFYRSFGVDVLTARTLHRGKALALLAELNKEIGDLICSR